MVTYTIKPLVWETIDNVLQSAFTPFFGYTLERKDGGFVVRIRKCGTLSESSWFDFEAAAKAFCDSHNQSMLAWFLEPSDSYIQGLADGMTVKL